MTDKPFGIFVVDDDSLLRMVIMDQLSGNNYTLHEFDTGDACLAMLHLQPNLILLDIEMPGKSGIEICRQIRAEGYNDVQIIFVSSHDDLEILLQAFAAGGNDFVPKNAPKDVLLLKVDIAIAHEAKRRQLKSQISSAQQIAFTAMSSLGETGMVLQYLRASFACMNLQQLGELIIDHLQQFDLKALVRLTDDLGAQDFNSEGLCTPLESSILSYVIKMGRIYQSQDRLVLNYPHISILVLELNLDDVDGIGRLRDNLAIIAEGTGVRIDAMAAEQFRLRQANEQLASVKELNDFFEQIEARQQKHRRQFEALIDQHRKEMEEDFMYLGLTDAQELKLQRSVTYLTNEMEKLFHDDYLISVTLHEIITKQKRVLGMQ